MAWLQEGAAGGMHCSMPKACNAHKALGSRRIICDHFAQNRVNSSSNAANDQGGKCGGHIIRSRVLQSKLPNHELATCHSKFVIVTHTKNAAGAGPQMLGAGIDDLPLTPHGLERGAESAFSLSVHAHVPIFLELKYVAAASSIDFSTTCHVRW